MGDISSNGQSSNGQRQSRYNASNVPPYFGAVNSAFERHMRKRGFVQSKNEARGLCASADHYYSDSGPADDLVRFMRNTELLIEDDDGKLYYDSQRFVYVANCVQRGADPVAPHNTVLERIALIDARYNQPVGERPSDVDGIPAVQATVVEVLPCRVVGELAAAAEVNLQVLLPAKETPCGYTLFPAVALARLTVPDLRMHQEEIRAHLGRLTAYLEGAALVEAESIERRMQEIKEERSRVERESTEKMEEIDKAAKNQIAALDAEEAALIG